MQLPFLARLSGAKPDSRNANFPPGPLSLRQPSIAGIIVKDAPRRRGLSSAPRAAGKGSRSSAACVAGDRRRSWAWRRS